MSLNLDLLVQYFCSFVLVLACRFVWTFWCNIPAPLSWCKLSLCFDFLVQYPFFFVLVQTCPFAPGESLSPLFRLFGAISLLLCPGASPLARSLPIWSWPSLQWVAATIGALAHILPCLIKNILQFWVITRHIIHHIAHHCTHGRLVFSLWWPWVDSIKWSESIPPLKNFNK